MSIQSEAFFLCKKGAASEAFELRDFNIESPKGADVLVESEAFGLNYADVMARQGLYREAPPMPCVVGYEVVGKIVQCGPDADPQLLGKRVVAFCRFGGYSKHVITNGQAIVIVGNESSEELLALCTQAVTAYYMSYYLAPVHPSDVVLIHAAAGGVGTILIQLAKMKGAKVIAKIGSDSKKELVEKLGADFVVNYNTSEYDLEIKKYLGDKRVDISYNPVAGSTFKKDMGLIGSGGRLVLFGGSELGQAKWGIFSQLNFVRKMGLVLPIGLMMRSKNILGVNMLKIADNRPEVLQMCLSEVFKMYQQKTIIPQVGGVFEQSDLHLAHAALESGKTTGKLVVKWQV
jgi:NADPH:quinone reductase-like Zn-dependent oxidoreductase